MFYPSAFILFSFESDLRHIDVEIRRLFTITLVDLVNEIPGNYKKKLDFFFAFKLSNHTDQERLL